MRKLSVVFVLLAVGVLPLSAQDGSGERVFDVASVVAQPVAELGTPRLWLEMGEVNLPVSSTSPEARAHVQQGFALVHSAWDFEAYRHFAAALKADPDCLLAYCGIALALANPQHEFSAQRSQALDHMIVLAGSQKLVDGEKVYIFPEIERGYAAAIGELMLNGVGRGAAGFKALSQRYPKDLQARLLAAFLSRGGYNELGTARESQQRAIAEVAALVKENPQNPLPLNFLLLMQAEAPHTAVDVKKDLLPKARKLVKMSDTPFPERLALLGHFAWRSGELDEAQSSFERAIQVYEQWQDEDQVADADVANLLRARIYLAAVHHAKGNHQQAHDLCDVIRTIKLPADRQSSDAAYVIQWNASMMPSKMYLARGGKENVAKALKHLPVLQSEQAKKSPHFALVVSGYQLFLEGLLASEGGNLEKAQIAHSRLAIVLQKMQGSLPVVAKTAIAPHFMQAYQSLTVYHNELAARISSEGLGYNWYCAAIDAQRPGARQLPPDILYPEEYLLGIYLQKMGDEKGAKDAFIKAARRRPHHSPSMKAANRVNESSN